jgi:hypothetical protein
LKNYIENNNDNLIIPVFIYSNNHFNNNSLEEEIYLEKYIIDFEKLNKNNLRKEELDCKKFIKIY